MGDAAGPAGAGRGLPVERALRFRGRQPCPRRGPDRLVCRSEPQRAQREGTDAYRRLHAKCLLEQAEGLLRWHDYGEVEWLAQAAARMRVAFNAYEMNPQLMLQRIETVRSQSLRTAGRGLAARRAEQRRSGGPSRAALALSEHGGDRVVYDPGADPTRTLVQAGAQPGAAHSDAAGRRGSCRSGLRVPVVPAGRSALRHTTRKRLAACSNTGRPCAGIGIR